MRSIKSPAILLAMAALAFSAMPSAGGVEHRLLVEVGADRQVVVHEGLAQVEVAAGRDQLQVLAAEEVEEWRIVILLDELFSDTRLLRNATLDLSALAVDLTALGTVEVVVAGDDVETAVPPTRDALQLDESLGWLRARAKGRAEQLEIRRRFVEEFELQSLAEAPDLALSATAGKRIDRIAGGLRTALADEVAVVQKRRSALVRWAVDERPSGPSLLIWVSGGGDVPDLEFYRSVLAAAEMADAAEGVVSRRPRLGHDDLAQTLAVLGWRTVAYAPSALDAVSPEGEAGSQKDDEAVETVVQDGQVVDRTMLARIDPRDLLRRRSEEPLQGRLLRPLEEVRSVAEATGGELAMGLESLRKMVAALGHFVVLRVAQAEPSWEPQPLTVGWRRSGSEVSALGSARWVGAGLPRAASQERALRLLEGGLEDGDLAASGQLVFAGGASRVVVEVEDWLQPQSGDDSPIYRAVAAAYDGEEPLFEHVALLADTAEEPKRGAIRLEGRLDFEPSSSSPLVIVVEELHTSRWGAIFPSIIDPQGLEASGLLLPTSRALHLLEPEVRIAFGPTLFEVVYDPEVARVEYVLDGRTAARVATPPFSARLDLGPLPEPHRVEAIAFDETGRELARDRLLINDAGAALRVRIVRPEPAGAAADQKPLVGPVEVEARVEVPRGEDLDRVEFFWNEELVATRFAAPYSQWITIPEEQPKGFFRVVGRLVGGTFAEDVLFVNSPGASERVRVELVQLFAVVTDRQGRTLNDLGAAHFTVREDGVLQELATVSEANDQPLTVGLAIDASASMFQKLPQVQEAAASFLHGLDGSRDRAFVVDFGHEPRLHHDTSRNLRAVEASVHELEPEGRTAIWKGITFSLVQLQGVPGRKAVIVFSDGADEDPDFSFRTCLRFARRVGVPVYVIVSNNEIHRTQGRGLNVRGFMNRLESLTRTVGGRVFVTRVGEDLKSIYAEIDDELRRQYLLGYYARDPGEPRWRLVEVEVDRPGARVRTAAGYYR